MHNWVLAINALAHAHLERDLELPDLASDYLHTYLYRPSSTSAADGNCGCVNVSGTQASGTPCMSSDSLGGLAR